MNINKYTKREQKQIRAMNDERTRQYIEEHRVVRHSSNTFLIGDFFKVQGNKITGRM